MSLLLFNGIEFPDPLKEIAVSNAATVVTESNANGKVIATKINRPTNNVTNLGWGMLTREELYFLKALVEENVGEVVFDDLTFKALFVSVEYGYAIYEDDQVLFGDVILQIIDMGW
ncbi:MAG: hypothetical protein R3Y09_13245 [Clostridia bacterium]